MYILRKKQKVATATIVIIRKNITTTESTKKFPIYLTQNNKSNITNCVIVNLRYV